MRRSSRSRNRKAGVEGIGVMSFSKIRCMMRSLRWKLVNGSAFLSRLCKNALTLEIWILILLPLE
jgi:hypothetical protein